jgi:hypothetical protein
MLIALPLLVASPARALDGPSLVTPRTPIGELRLMSGDVKLVYEELELKILNLDEVEVRATYQVHNPGPEVVLPYGVPITSGGKDGHLRASQAAASVRVLSGGRFVPCLIEDGPPLALPHAALGSAVSQWCTADLVVPSGISEVRLSYEGLLLYRRDAPTDGWLPTGADRKLLFSLAPGASWKGKPDTLSITFDAGPYAGRATVVSPPEPFESGRIASWNIDRPDHGKLGVVEVDLRAADWDRSANLFAHASDRAQATEAALSDGDPATAYCTREPATVDFQWAETPSAVKGPTCSGGVLFVPGDRSRWSATAPESLVLTSCANPPFEQVLPTTRSDDPKTSGQAVPLDAAVTTALSKSWAAGEPGCVRLSVTPPAGGEACVSELALPVSCLP